MTNPLVAPNPYGNYDAENQEFVITRPDTPTPWINYLGEGRYGGIISNTGGGYSFDQDPRNRRVTRYRYNAVPIDQPGRYVYLRDQDSGEFWSPTWQPVVSRHFDFYECRHGCGYTQISSSFKDINTQILYFIPPRDNQDSYPCELWRMRVKNIGTSKRVLRTFSYVELCYWDAITDQTNLDWGMHIVHTRYQDGTLITSTQFRPTFTFFSSSLSPIGFDSDREAFIGRYRDLASPVVVEMGQPRLTEAPRGNNVAVLCHELELAPGEEKELTYILGILDSQTPQQAIKPILDRFSQSINVENAYQQLKAGWKEFLDCFIIHTPDEEMNNMLNFWNAVQCRTNLYWSRFISGYDTGLGRGMGTRDSAQDTLGTVNSLPEHTQKVLSMLWKLQFIDGHTWHQVFPLTGEGGPGLAAEFPDWPQWFSDDHLWLVIAVVSYLRETGDFAYLDERLPYQDGGSDTVWEHIRKAIHFTLSNLGPHSLPRLGFSDWDDTMNLDHGSGKAESVWCGMQFCRALLDLFDLCNFLDNTTEADYYKSWHAKMVEAIEKFTWDGEWYARAYDDDGLPVGVKSETSHQINLNPQTWSVIGEIGNLERCRQAMQAAHEQLNTPFGLRLMKPPYTSSDLRVRGTSTFPPGAKENGSIFCHANTWAIIAAARLGWVDRAYQYYRQILPLTRTDANVYLAEPYVYCQNICAPEHPQYGMGRNSWLTGTASWAYVAGTQWILGIRPTFYGLQIDPAIPSAWEGFSATRLFRGVTYDISVERRGTGKNITLYIDDKSIDGNIIPFPSAGVQKVYVKTLLG
jgi:cellobiose phosphorylase